VRAWDLPSPPEIVRRRSTGSFADLGVPCTGVPAFEDASGQDGGSPTRSPRGRALARAGAIPSRPRPASLHAALAVGRCLVLRIVTRGDPDARGRRAP